MLRDTIKSIGAGYVPREDRLTFEAMVDHVRLDHRAKACKSDDIDQRMKHLAPFFGGMRAPEITTERVNSYVTLRMDEDAKPATINRELAVLRRAVKLSELSRQPRITMLPENNARLDFLNLPDFRRVCEEIPTPVFRDFWAFGYFSLWRQGQVAKLEWRDVDLNSRQATARGETTKNGQPHTTPLVGELWEIVERRHAERTLECPSVFHHEGHEIRLRGGTAPIRAQWKAATAKVGFTGHVPHCTRRSGIRNMIRAGIDADTTMKQSGHKTAKMLSRYNITEVDDQRRALEQTMERLAAEPEDVKVRVIR